MSTSRLILAGLILCPLAVFGYDYETFWQPGADAPGHELRNPHPDHCARPDVWRYEWDGAGRAGLAADTPRNLMTWNTTHGWWANGDSSAIIAPGMFHPAVGLGTDLTWTAPALFAQSSGLRISGTVRQRDRRDPATAVTIYQLAAGKMTTLWTHRLISNQPVAYDLKARVRPGDQIIFRVTATGEDASGCTVEIDPLLCVDTPETAPVTIERVADTSGISDHDSLHDVYPEIAANLLCEGRISPSLVDENPRFNNMIVIRHDRGPVNITWDLGTEIAPAKAQLDSLAIWLGTSGDGNFCGQLAVSTDGQQFTPVPGTFVRQGFPVGKNPDANWSLNPEDLKDQNKKGGAHLVRYSFRPGQVKGFRYLRIVSFGYNGGWCRLKKVNADISGVTVRKSTEIATTIRPLTAAETAGPVPTDQTVYPPVRVHPLRFAGDRLVLAQTGKALLDLRPLLMPEVSAGAAAPAVERQESSRQVQTIIRQTDGLVRTCRLTIDGDNRVKLDINLAVPATAPRAAPFTKLVLPFREAAVAFDGVTYGFGSPPVFLPRNEPSGFDIGTPYLIFPAAAEGVELQMLMPDWYDIKGRIKTFQDRQLATWELFKAVNNINVQYPSKEGNRWREAATTVAPGETLTFHITLAVLAISPPTIGQKDVEGSKSDFEPMVGIEMGIPGRGMPGIPRVLERDKMLFMGFQLPPARREKAGHQLSIWHTWDDTKTLDRFKAAGVGSLLLHSEYVDVSHGVSLNGKYDQAPPGLKKLLGDIRQRGMDTIFWFSPRGFLQAEWLGRPKDVIVEQHPDWFFKEAHWFDKYRTINWFNPAANDWVVNKFKRDLTEYPELNGFGLDSFAGGGGCMMGGPGNRVTGQRQERNATETFSRAIHGMGPGHLLLANYPSPQYDDLQFYDFVFAEHPPLMFMNEVTGGRSLGHTFLVYTRWGQMYFWYAVLAHMYYNFCDYDQALGWIGPGGVAILDNDQKPVKPVDAEIVPLWYIMGKGTRVFGAQIAPGIRQVEARLPDGSMRVIVCSMSPRPADLCLRPQKVPPGIYTVTATVDTATQNRVVYQGQTTLPAQTGFDLKQIPPYSTTVFSFTR